MDSQALDEDEVDIATLQAQIDLSMSFAQDLVTSWVKPSHKLATNSHRDMERELKEYMRRPPRLGVGAPIPEMATLSRDTARLKYHLSKRGRKRAREEGDDVQKQISDDEEESRAGAIKKKAKLDPFGDGHGHRKKKKKTEPNGMLTPRLTPRPSHDGSPGHTDVVEMEIDGDDDGKGHDPSDPTVSSLGMSLSKKKNRKKNRLDLALATPPSTGSHVSSNSEAEVVNLVLTTPLKAEHSASEFKTPIRSPEVLDISLIATPYALASPIRHKTSPISHLKQPLLNLDGPPVVDEDSEDEGKRGMSEVSPKKKRKRRKKKRPSLVNGGSDDVHQKE